MDTRKPDRGLPPRLRGGWCGHQQVGPSRPVAGDGAEVQGWVGKPRMGARQRGHGQGPGMGIRLGARACLPEPCWVTWGELGSSCAQPSPAWVDRWQSLGRAAGGPPPHTEVVHVCRPPVLRGSAGRSSAGCMCAVQLPGPEWGDPSCLHGQLVLLLLSTHPRLLTPDPNDQLPSPDALRALCPV